MWRDSLARTEWGVEDEEILAAVACHTTGRPHMTRLDKILFLADMTSADRSYPEVELSMGPKRLVLTLAIRN